MEQQLVNHLVDEADSGLFVGDLSSAREYNHAAVLKGVNCVNVFLVLCLYFEESAHETYALQMLSQLTVFVVLSETLDYVLNFLRLFAFTFGELTET